ncbi:MAG: cell wall-active antibiotics response protein LiaF [candidate division KSB1 bacterium]|nr:cell wall-active antibiotics response protein LiaF [candidate division KSB1 bacterium]MDZ7273410.1 cell wall-active antibiotics response protein LiaF [candidate division KSB1 bacterium]MDZ7286997.1 cell wall-active antibiotics response protein LiaF [candidate division KSB1 bacterium]MDZ7299650.1 cell wall-active antibiotics response protein LiaF [candidate division KSB1 bacterium]MDZ7309307.1 cell wall-active antibiotics response protein LiaF [candidate division KSB1 bacterium]
MSANECTGSRFFWGGMLILLGTLLLLDRLELLSFRETIRNFWPLILVAIGARMILFPKNREESTITVSPTAGADSASFIGSTVAGDYLNENRFIGDIHLQVRSDDFKGGAVSTFIGEQKFDLSGIAILGGERALVVSGFIGDATLILPKTIPCLVHVSTGIGDLVVFGKKESGLGLNKVFKSPDYDHATARLNVRISFVIGDVTIL